MEGKGKCRKACLSSGVPICGNILTCCSYKIYNAEKTFRGAQAQCATDGAYLAYPTSDAENTFIAGLITRGYFWIGVNDIDEEGKWVTDDGHDIFYSNWHTYNDGRTEPSKRRDEDGVVMNGRDWWDREPNIQYPFICYFRVDSKL